MRKILFIFIALFSFLEIYGQGKEKTNNNNDINRIILHENRFDKLIDLAESYMKTNPEFAFSCAYKAEEIANQTNDKKKQACSKITIGDIFNKNNIYSLSVGYYENAVNDLLSIKDYVTINEIYIKIAELYRNNYIDSRWSNEAMENALHYAQMTNNQNIIIKTNIEYAEILLSQKNHKDALKYYNKILKYDINDNTINKIAKALTSIANIKAAEKNYQEALILADSSLKLSKNKDKILTINNYGLKGHVFDSIMMFDSAKNYYNKAAALAFETENFDLCSEYMHKIGLLNINHNKINEAITVFKILSDSTEKFKMYDYCNNAFYQLSKCHAILGNYNEAYRLLNKYDIYNTIANNQRQEKKIKDINTNYLLALNFNEIKTKEIESENIKKNKQNMIILTLGAIIFLTSIMVILILFTKNKYLQHKSMETSYEQQLKIDKMENELMEIQLKSNKESLINLALHFKSYIEYINPLKAKLKEAIDAPENEQKVKLKNIYMEMQNNNGLFNNTENLYKQINDIYKDFIDRLEQKYPTITKSEKRLCAMLYINMSSKEIAVISNTTIRSVETSRYRLRKKFNLSRDEDMVNFLRTI
ncbi:MAG: hypothetical protein IKU01_02575 [Bacteroidales bacterium]|nr:hypothetical protein [Bacteroidales bacterium]